MDEMCNCEDYEDGELCDWCWDRECRENAPAGEEAP